MLVHKGTGANRIRPLRPGGVAFSPECALPAQSIDTVSFYLGIRNPVVAQELRTLLSLDSTKSQSSEYLGSKVGSN